MSNLHHGDGNGLATLQTRICPRDERFGYSLYQPSSISSDETPELLVVIHGSDFKHESMCRYFAGLANEMQCLVLAPLFAPIAGGRPDPNGYKFLRSDYAAYDQILLDMVNDVATRLHAHDRFFLFGFSGGAQFAHRFFYVYPERLHAVSIAAPGMVTLLDPELDAWAGTKNLISYTHRDFNIDDLRNIPTQLLVGAEDTTPHHGPAGEIAYNLAGSNRVERLRTLDRNYRAAGIVTDYAEVVGAAHELEPLGAAAISFFRREIRRARANAAHKD